MNYQNEFVIDSRTQDDLLNELSTLAANYTPEWNFDLASPDIGSVIGIAFAAQVAQNIHKLNLAVNKYHTEFVNLLNLSLLPAKPASGIVVVNLLSGITDGIELKNGTKLHANNNEDEKVVFETVNDVYITNSKITDIISVSPSLGKIIPVKGSAVRAKLVDSHDDEVKEKEFLPFKLFDFSNDGIEQNGIMLYHSCIFDTEFNINIWFRFYNELGENISTEFLDTDKYRFHYYSKDGFMPFEKITEKNNSVLLCHEKGTEKLTIDNTQYSAIYIERLGAVDMPLELGNIEISSSSKNNPLDYAYYNAEDLDTYEFMPFGESASLFDECYLGCDKIFNKKGSLITLDFDLEFIEKLVTLTLEKEQEELKVIKRKPRVVHFDTANTFIGKIAIEYYNGKGFKRLECTEDISQIFNGSVKGKVAISFVCPSDFEELTIGGNHGRMIKLKVLVAQNCYLQPCMHKMPVIKNINLSYTYFNDWKNPQRLSVICGTKKVDLTNELIMHKPITVFSPLDYDTDYLFVGFDKKPKGSPVSLFFKVKDNVNETYAQLKFEYYTNRGFKPLNFIDKTKFFSTSGTISLMFNEDFSKSTIEGVSRYYLRISNGGTTYDKKNSFKPEIEEIYINAVDVKNTETLDAEEFYIDTVTPNMSFDISANNILCADVFVNETNTSSRELIEKMINKSSENIFVNYDYLGNVEDFFVKWEEVDNFDSSNAGDRHYVIDRLKNQIHFGDGVNVRIPSASTKVSFFITVKCCSGEQGNIPKFSDINTVNGQLYVDDIYTPVDFYGGTNIETTQNAHKRGAYTLCSKNRLVSEQDYVRETFSVSDVITQVKCVVGRRIDASVSNDAVCIVVLTKDYQNGSYTFLSIKDDIKNRLLEKSELTISENSLQICEPVFVKISVEIWLENVDEQNRYNQNEIVLSNIREYFDPNSNVFSNVGKIGELPSLTEIEVMLYSIRSEVNIKYFIALAHYVDKNAEHSKELACIEKTPFMIAVNGEHKIHYM